MKKLYTFSLAAVVALGASASLPAGKVPFAAGVASSETKLAVRSAHAAESVPVAAHKYAAPAKAYDTDEWESLGTGTFKENIILGLYGLESTVDIPVEIAKSKTTEGLYRIQNPYKTLADTYSTVFSYDASAAEPIYAHVVADNKFYIDGFESGLTDLEDNAAITVSSQAYNLVANNGVETVLSVVPEAFGDFKNGVFDFGGATFVLNGSTYYDLLLQIGVSKYAGNKYGLTKIALPGVVVKDYSISIDYSNCADGNKFTFACTCGADVAGVKVMYVQGEFDATQENLEYVASKGQGFTAEQAKALTLDLSSYPDGVFTFFAVTLDAEGALANGAYAWAYVVNDNADEWKTLEGNAKYTDDIVASIYQNHADTEREVAVQENIATPGLYRLVNPYAAPYAFATQNVHEGEHNHYIYINAVNPEQVYLTESPIGFELGDGAMVVSSLAYMNLQNEADPSAYYGTLKDNVITFPQKALVAREMKYQNGAWYYANANNAFKVVLPESAGINDIISDDAQAAPVYYNLQGVRVANPENGMFIEVRGNKAVKVVK